MSDFLTFLNTADLDTLTQVQGVTRSLAGNLIAARPFETAEDCLKVKGMGKSLLAKLETHAQALEIGLRSRAMVPVEQEAAPAFMERSQPAPEPEQNEDTFLKRLGWALLAFFRALVRLVMLAILILGVGALFYYGLPYIQRTFIAPLERNTSQIEMLEAEIESLQTQLDEMNSRVSALETSVEAHTQSIQKLEEMQAVLETQMQTSNDAILLELKQEVMFTRALDILARARLYLAQSNFGLAEADVKTARDLLAELQSDTGDEVLAQAITRLDMALANLPEFPVIAAGDLEIAWEILMAGVVPATPTATVSATPTPFESTITPTPALAETFTPTPFPPPSLEPTPTP